ncbi:hypothetical protein BCT94_16850 [Vibrio breoganii]|uniref:DUF4426 domain-containing protein n=1 Tax=Vibrio breoganii TaxID=553239 RepID=UPI000C81AF74|nr:DUF4426 domain-containing protein [Vibrio breoganii]PMK68305.1 hypothetical protein BCT94_16850 [Vibrio breoganii]
MTKLLIRALCTLLIAGFAMPSWAEQFVRMKDIELHYSAFNSTFIAPEIARGLKLKRNPNVALINISALDLYSVGKKPTLVALKGTAKNLVGNTRTLEFREITQGEAIYYLAELPITENETYRFEIKADAGSKGSGILRFNQTFHIQE